jgi:Glycosyl hydrolase family 9
MYRVSPLGQRFTVEWGSNRFAASGAAIALMWANLPEEMRAGAQVSQQDARCMAVKQLHYFAGDNDRGSYIAGFGNNPPLRNHHRNSVCAPWEQREASRGTCEEYATHILLKTSDLLLRIYPPQVSS